MRHDKVRSSLPAILLCLVVTARDSFTNHITYPYMMHISCLKAMTHNCHHVAGTCIMLDIICMSYLPINFLYGAKSECDA